jgi:hypothetical protein
VRIVSERQRAGSRRDLSRFLRGRQLDRNPLRRPVDRAETIMLTLLLVAFLVGAPLATLASGA